MAALEVQDEASLSVSILKMTMNEHPNATSSDSFSSQPDSSYNRGAIQFLELLEKVLGEARAKEEAVRFEDLVIQMLDLSMDRKLSTPDAISGMLNDQGWNADQVARVWQVSTGPQNDPEWTHEKLMELGGKEVAIDVWNTLKEKKLTGNPKRPLAEDGVRPGIAKKSRKDMISSEGTNVVLVGSPETQEMPDTFTTRTDSQSTPIQTPSQSKRRKRRARKAVLLATPRITDWFPKTPLLDAPEDILEQATPPPNLPNKTRKRANKKMRETPVPFLRSPSPRNAAGSAPMTEKAKAKKTSLGYQSFSKSKEDLAPKTERPQPSPNPTCHMEGAVQRVDEA